MDAFFGEIRAFPYNFIPLGWLACDGNQYTVAQYQILHSIIGYTYGGSGAVFKVPDLRGYVPIGEGTPPGGLTYAPGHPVGTPTVTLTQGQMASHDHGLQTQAGSTRVTAPSSAALPAAPLQVISGQNFTWLAYTPTTATPAPTQATMSPLAIQPNGSSASHDNHSPLLILRYCINAEAPDSLYPVRA
ncbi:phage tail protein [Azospirillum sp. B2RO_4]|uniref:phage tail protein n=1 Tax=Azospirillum sp. B2RO_4 TaxID=3027796 RepID=UPI003DA7B366